MPKLTGDAERIRPSIGNGRMCRERWNETSTNNSDAAGNGGVLVGIDESRTATAPDCERPTQTTRGRRVQQSCGDAGARTWHHIFADEALSKTVRTRWCRPGPSAHCDKRAPSNAARRARSRRLSRSAAYLTTGRIRAYRYLPSSSVQLSV